MDRLFVILACALLGLKGASAQPWLEGMGGGIGPQGVIRMSNDLDGDGLIIAGAFAYANGAQVSPGVVRWRDGVFESIGCGVEWDCVSFINNGGVPPSLGLAEWNGSLFLGGEWSFTRNDQEFNFIMQWNGQDWEPLGQGLDDKVTSIRVIDDQLIVTGWFQYADTVLANGLARWDGQRWHRVVDVPQFFPGHANYINDVALFEGEWYIGGVLLGMGDIARWNGENWEQVGGGFAGSYSSVQKLDVHEDRLYISGTFSACPPFGVPANPGSGIVAWDGSGWDGLGGGTCGAGVPDVFGTTWWNGDLYVGGRFDRIGDVPCGQIAQWDGEEWCALLPQGFFTGGGPNALAVLNDSLYIGGSFTEAGDPPIHSFAKWIGGDQRFGCGVVLGMEETEIVQEWAVYPNPAVGYVDIAAIPAGASTFLLVDALGRRVSEFPARSRVEFEGVAPGCYTFMAVSRHGRILSYARLVVR